MNKRHQIRKKKCNRQKQLSKWKLKEEIYKKRRKRRRRKIRATTKNRMILLKNIRSLFIINMVFKLNDRKIEVDINLSTGFLTTAM